MALKISIRFLDKLYCALLSEATAGCVDPRDLLEWPPSPERLLRAFVSSAASFGVDPGRLQFFADLGPPNRIVSEPLKSELVTSPHSSWGFSHDVRSGLGTSELKYNKAKLSPQKHFHPPVFNMEIGLVDFVWDDAQLSEDEVAFIQSVASNVCYFGRSESIALLSVDANRCVDLGDRVEWGMIDGPPGSVVSGAVPVRSFDSSSIGNLVSAYKNGTSPLPAQVCWYSSVDNLVAKAPGVISVKLMFGEPQPYNHFPLLSAAVKHQLTKEYKKMCALVDSVPYRDVHVPPPLSGHWDGRLDGTHRNVQFTPVLSSPRRESGCMVVGVVAHIPDDIATTILPATLNVRRLYVYNDLGVSRGTPVVNSKPSKVWTTETPCVAHFRGQLESPAQILEEVNQWARFAGLPPVTAAQYHKDPVVPGVSRMRWDDVHIKKPGSEIRRFPGHKFSHVTLSFDRPVTGPVLLGNGTTFGFGSMIPWRA